jgi:hypothetical protein
MRSILFIIQEWVWYSIVLFRDTDTPDEVFRIPYPDDVVLFPQGLESKM